jgi:hypothetical protein
MIFSATTRYGRSPWSSWEPSLRKLTCPEKLARRFRPDSPGTVFYLSTNGTRTSTGRIERQEEHQKVVWIVRKLRRESSEATPDGALSTSKWYGSMLQCKQLFSCRCKEAHRAQRNSGYAVRHFTSAAAETFDRVRAVSGPFREPRNLPCAAYPTGLPAP